MTCFLEPSCIFKIIQYRLLYKDQSLSFSTYEVKSTELIDIIRNEQMNLWTLICG